jgi:hypothetical protein
LCVPKVLCSSWTKFSQKKTFYVQNKTLYMKKVFLFVHHIKHLQKDCWTPMYGNV